MFRKSRHKTILADDVGAFIHIIALRCFKDALWIKILCHYINNVYKTCIMHQDSCR